LTDTAQRFMADFPAPKSGSFELRVTLSKVDKTSTGITCKIGMVISKEPGAALIISLNGGATVSSDVAGATDLYTSDDPAIYDCIEAVVEDLVKKKARAVIVEKNR